jgi:hypothetical protein
VGTRLWVEGVPALELVLLLLLRWQLYLLRKLALLALLGNVKFRK